MFFFFYPPSYPQFSEQFRQIRAVLDILEDQRSGLSVTTLRLWLYIAENLPRIMSEQGLPLKEVAKELDIPYGTLGRQLDLLEDGYGTQAGLGWVERGIDPTNRRLRRLRLTDDGLRLAFRIDELVSGEPSPWRPFFLSNSEDREEPGTGRSDGRRS